MRTTLDIDDRLLRRAKQLAAKEQISLTSLIEEGLAALLREASTSAPPSRKRLPVFSGKGGLQAAVKNPKSLQSILDAIDTAGNTA